MKIARQIWRQIYRQKVRQIDVKIDRKLERFEEIKLRLDFEKIMYFCNYCNVQSIYTSINVQKYSVL